MSGDLREQLLRELLRQFAQRAGGAHFSFGERVRKRSGAQWSGRVVGWYCTALTPVGYAVESDAHAGSVQIYPATALEPVKACERCETAAQCERTNYCACYRVPFGHPGGTP